MKRQYRGLLALAMLGVLCLVIAMPDSGLIKYGADNGAGTVVLVEPDPIKHLSNVVQVAAATESACALISTNGSLELGEARGVVKCWGSNIRGQLGIGDKTPIIVAPTSVVLEDKTPLTGVKDISLSIYHGCAVVDNNGTDEVYCWGNGGNGIRGVTKTTTVYNAVKTLVDSNGRTIEKIVTSSGHTCVLFDDGSVTCWGNNSYGQLGVDNKDVKYSGTPLAIKTSLKFTDIAVATAATCGIVQNGKVYCWGKYNKLGSGEVSKIEVLEDKNMFSPDPVEATLVGTDNKKIFGGSSTDFAVIKNDGQVYHWGTSAYLKKLDSANALSVSLCNMYSIHLNSSDHSMQKNGSTYVYQNDDSKLGAFKDSRITKVFCGGGSPYAYYALRDDGFLYGWGNNNTGQMANGYYGLYQLAVEVPGLGLASDKGIRAGSVASGVINLDSTMNIWGGTNTSGRKKVMYNANEDVTGINDAFVNSASCVSVNKDNKNKIYCLGDNTYSGLARTTKSSTSQFAVEAFGKDGEGTLEGEDLTISSDGYYGGCATLEGGEATCWGMNDMGQVGNHRIGHKNDQHYIYDDNTTQLIEDFSETNEKGEHLFLTAHEVAKTVTNVLNEDKTPLRGAQKIQKGRYVSCALMYDNRVMCWGGKRAKIINSEVQDYQTYASVGDGSSFYKNIEDNTLYPVYVVKEDGSELTNIVDIQVEGIACAIDADGHLWCWGRNASGEIGYAGLTSSGSRKTIITYAAPIYENKDGKLLSNVEQVAVGYYHACALLNEDGHHVVKCWGSNTYGQLGDGTLTAKTAPTYVKDDTGNRLEKVTSIDAGTYHTCAISNNKAYCWGSASSGQNGNERYTVPAPMFITASYRIYGKVTGVHNGGVEIGAGILGSVKTDDSGNYQLVLPYGEEYTITAQLGDYAYIVDGGDSNRKTITLDGEIEINFTEIQRCTESLQDNCVTCLNDSECSGDEHCENPGSLNSSCERDPEPCSANPDYGKIQRGEKCTAGKGVCAVEGVYICDSITQYGDVKCSVDPDMTKYTDEICDGLDNNCNGEVDEDFKSVLDSVCYAGEGPCQVQGQYKCSEDGTDVTCNAKPKEPSQEICGDNVDNDCDGQVDESECDEKITPSENDDGDDDGDDDAAEDGEELCEDAGEACTAGIGACERGGVKVCNAGVSSCSAVAGVAGVEICGDGIDNDCDGNVDESDCANQCTEEESNVVKDRILATTDDLAEVGRVAARQLKRAVKDLRSVKGLHQDAELDRFYKSGTKTLKKIKKLNRKIVESLPKILGSCKVGNKCVTIDNTAAKDKMRKASRRLSSRCKRIANRVLFYHVKENPKKLWDNRPEKVKKKMIKLKKDRYAAATYELGLVLQAVDAVPDTTTVCE